MKFLIDTNIFIPLEPVQTNNLEPDFDAIVQLANFANLSKCQLWTHPAQFVDIAQDRNEERRLLRHHLFGKYPKLNFTKQPIPDGRTNDWVDDQLLFALKQNSVDFLVTNDTKLSRHCAREGLRDRTLNPFQAVELLREYSAPKVSALPNVETTEAYTLDASDPFWNSFIHDYGQEFRGWLSKCQTEHRTCFVVRDENINCLIAVAIVNHERTEPRGERILKICSFKVSPDHNGRRLGELLLKQIFKFAFENRYDSLFLTTFPKHDSLVVLFTEFGFVVDSTTRANGEILLSKKLLRDHVDVEGTNALSHHVEYVPYSVNFAARRFVVPIQPKFHEMLFPESQAQGRLFTPDVSHGNAIRKAYLCHSNITTITPGSLLLFYRSQDEHNVKCLGVVESTLRSADSSEISSFVLQRTVYTEKEISALATQGEVLAIRFRQCFAMLRPAIEWNELSNEAQLAGAPNRLLCSRRTHEVG